MEPTEEQPQGGPAPTPPPLDLGEYVTGLANAVARNMAGLVVAHRGCASSLAYGRLTGTVSVMGRSLLTRDAYGREKVDALREGSLLWCAFTGRYPARDHSSRLSWSQWWSGLRVSLLCGGLD